MNNNSNGGNGFLAGFLIGAAIGGVAVFFLGTKKGKQLLKTISEEGLDSISDLAEYVEEEVEEKIEEKVAPVVEKIKEVKEEVKEAILQEEPEEQMPEASGQPAVETNGHTKKQPLHRRLFKGIPKRS